MNSSLQARVTPTSGSASKIRGNVLIARLTFVRDRGGEEAVQRVLGSLPPDDQTILKSKLWDAGLYSFELNQRLDRAIANTMFTRSPSQAFIQMGRASAENNLLGPHQVFVTPNDPQRFLAQAPYIYKFYYAAGRRTYEKLGPKSGVIRTFEAEGVSANDCLTVVGWHQRALEICGATEVVVQERNCRTRGHGNCEYICSWATP